MGGYRYCLHADPCAAGTGRGDRPSRSGRRLGRCSDIAGEGAGGSEKSGKPISAKYESDDGKLQLSIYTMTNDGYNEVRVAPDTGTVISAEKIDDADDLKDATAQKEAMEKASVSLLAAT